MKQHLLLTAALVCVGATAMAEQNVTVQNAQKMQINAKRTAVRPASMVAQQGAMKAPTSVSDGVYYHRPKGTYYSGYVFGEEQANALMVPALTELTYVNACKGLDKTRAKWSFESGYDLSEYTDDDNNLVFDWSAATGAYEYMPMYSPILTLAAKNNNKEFQLADLTLTGREIMPMMREKPGTFTTYSGFEDGPGWGSGSVLEQQLVSEGMTPESYWLFFEQPASPLYVESFDINFWSENLDAMPEGKVLTLNVLKRLFNEKGEMVGTELMETIELGDLEFEEEFNGGGGFYGTASFAKTEIGVFGEELTSPVIIDYPFIVELKGHNQPGVNVHYFLAVVDKDPYETSLGGISRIHTLGADGEYYNYYWGNEEMIYGLSLTLQALWDKVSVATDLTNQNTGEEYSNCNILSVSNDGKDVVNVNCPALGGFVMVSTALPFFTTDEDGNVEGENYEVLDCPDWIMLMIDNSQWGGEEGGAENYITIECEALPEGETGRMAVLYLQGKGVVAEQPIVILQGDATYDPAAIETIHVAEANGQAYTIGGVKAVVNNGFMISNGQKLLKK